MAAKTISLVNKISPTAPRNSFVVSDEGDLIGFKSANGALTIFAAGNVVSVSADSSTTQAGGTPLKYQNALVTAAGASFSLTLPFTQVGMRLCVMNITAFTINVFPATGEQIEALGVNAARSMTTITKRDWLCAEVGRWRLI